MRIALLGFGRWGRNHARILAAQERLAAVVDPDPQRRAACRQLYPQSLVVAELDELRWPDVDGAVIASPIEHHVPQARIVLEQGKHCLVEKPLALDRDAADQLGALALASGRVLLTGHILDFHPGARELVRRCQSGQLGRLRSWHSSRARRVPPRNYVSVMEELLWHDLSVLLRVMGRLPDRIQTSGRLQEEGVLLLDFGDCSATLRGSQIQPLRESSMLVSGDEGTIRLDDELPGNGVLVFQRPEESAETIVLPNIEPLAAELDHFVLAASGAAVPVNGAKEAGEILTLLERVRTSCLA